MIHLKAAVIVFPGSNCDRDVAVALHSVTGQAPIMHWHRDLNLPQVDLIVIPGGFSYGDYLRTGAMAAHSPVMREVKARAESGTRVLGICNGFQILAESGLLPGVLIRNSALKFICKDVYLRCETSDSAFTNQLKNGDVVRMPVAHGEGNYFAQPAVIKALEDKDQVAFRYCDAEGNVTLAANPNGSINNIAGIFNEGRTVLGMMPHPERLADPLLGGTDGELVFASLLDALK